MQVEAQNCICLKLEIKMTQRKCIAKLNRFWKCKDQTVGSFIEWSNKINIAARE